MTRGKFKHNKVMRNKKISLFLVILTFFSFSTTNSFAQTKYSMKSVEKSYNYATFAGYGEGRVDVIKNKSGVLKDAFAIKFRVLGSENEVNGFCLHINQPLNDNEGIKYIPQNFPEIVGAGVSYQKASDIAVNHLTMGTPIPDTSLENVATQIAIWSFTNPDDFDLNDVTPSLEKSSILARVTYLIQNARNDRVKIVDSSVKVSAKISSNNLQIKLSSKDLNSIVGVPVTLTFSDRSSSVVVTDSNGLATFKKFKKGKSQISFTVTSGKGSIYAPATGQPIILGESFKINGNLNIIIK